MLTVLAVYYVGSRALGALLSFVAIKALPKSKETREEKRRKLGFLSVASRPDDFWSCWLWGWAACRFAAVGPCCKLTRRLVGRWACCLAWVAESCFASKLPAGRAG
jgi:hypothetical protein